MRHLSVCVICLTVMLTLFHNSVGLSESVRNVPTVSGGTLIGICYTNSGDEYGNIWSAELCRAEDGAMVLTVKESISASQPVTVSRYSAADDALQRVAEIVNANNMTALADRPDWLEVFDASHPYLILEILKDDGERISCRISGYIEMTDAESKAYSSLTEIVKESILPGHLIESRQTED